VEFGLTVWVAGLLVIPLWLNPSDQISDHGPVPVKDAWTVLVEPLQIERVPLTVELAAAPGWQLPPPQTSPVVHTEPSVQAEPSGLVGFEQAPVPESHVPATWH